MPTARQSTGQKKNLRYFIRETSIASKKDVGYGAVSFFAPDIYIKYQARILSLQLTGSKFPSKLRQIQERVSCLYQKSPDCRAVTQGKCTRPAPRGPCCLRLMPGGNGRAPALKKPQKNGDLGRRFFVAFSGTR
ncbi:hypothetical protein [Desulfovibrio sp. ZJ369]|uniref:hypothetical protein n=1 Tax=Desulfovibrio sp. ZJ369 TaxID=2709793 RepID=UPI0013ED243E|nr:hypothetical protein [Desulfovibrio sp. ZJ369]